MTSLVPKRNIVIIVVIFLAVILLIGLLFYINLSKHTYISVEATVTEVGSSYILVEDDEGLEYYLETEDEFNAGDRISFVMKDVIEDSNPIEGTLEKVDIVSRTVSFVIVDETASEDNMTDVDLENTSSDENDVIAYFETVNQKLDDYSDDTSLEDSIKNGFVTIVDFLFYEGEINGYTFSGLTDSAKIKVLQLAFAIDQKIENYFPDYKEKISETGSKIYTSVSSKIIESYLELTTSICENNENLCQSAKDGLSSLKTNFSLTWDFIKEISGITATKLKSWYEIWKEA